MKQHGLIKACLSCIWLIQLVSMQTLSAGQLNDVRFTQCECSCPAGIVSTKTEEKNVAGEAFLKDSPYIDDDSELEDGFGSGAFTDLDRPADDIFMSLKSPEDGKIKYAKDFKPRNKGEESGNTLEVTKQPEYIIKRGEKGDRGERGASGENGLPGPKGQNGKPGPAGLPGYPGLKGGKGDKGSTGPRGYPGSMGPQGYRGSDGPRGEPGRPGPRGNDGARGPRGEQGLRGPKGKQGVAGDKGEHGVPGTPGRDGAARSKVKIGFLARLIEHYGPSTASAHIIFPQVDFNMGQGYDPSSGSFLATTEGLYVFHLQAMAMADHIAWLAIQINGEPVAYVWASGYLSGVEQMGTTITMQHLKIGDTVNIVQKASEKPPNHLYAHYTLFAGYLLG